MCGVPTVRGRTGGNGAGGESGCSPQGIAALVEHARPITRPTAVARRVTPTCGGASSLTYSADLPA